jgi:hypothetical protein
VFGAILTLLTSRRMGRELADDTLRGAGLGGVAGAAFGFAIWLANRLSEV